MAKQEYWINGLNNPRRLILDFLGVAGEEIREQEGSSKDVYGYRTLNWSPEEGYDDAVHVFFDNSSGDNMMIKFWSANEDQDLSDRVISWTLPYNTFNEYFEGLSLSGYDKEEEIRFLDFQRDLLENIGKTGIEITYDKYDKHPTYSGLPRHPEIIYKDQGFVNYQDFLGISEADKLMNQLETKNKYRRKDFK